MPESYSTTNLIINNIPSSVTDEQLTKIFIKYGSIKSCKIIRHNEKDGKTFGFCEYNDPKAAKIALFSLNNFKLCDRILRVSFAKLFPKPKGKSIEVSNLPKYIQDDSLRKHFSQFGKICRMRFLNSVNPKLQTRTAEIIYDLKLEAERACSKNQTKLILESGKCVIVTVNMINERDEENGRIIYHDYNTNTQKQYGCPMLAEDNYFCLNSAANLMRHPSATIPSATGTSLLQAPASAYDLSALQSIFLPAGCAALNYQHPAAAAAGSPITLGNLSASAGFYSAQPYGYLSWHNPSPHGSIPFSPQPQQTNNNQPVTTALSLSGSPYEDKAGIHFVCPPNNHPHNPTALLPNQTGTYINYINPFLYSASIPHMLPAPPPQPAVQIPKLPYYQQPAQQHHHHAFNGGIYYSQQQQPNHQRQNNNSAVAVNGAGSVVYVYNIGNSTSKESLRELFGPKFGRDIVKIDIPKDSSNNASNKNFGFLTFSNHRSAVAAIDEMNGKDYQGKSLQVSFKK